MNHLNQTDPQIYKLIQNESRRQNDTLMLIPSENYASKAVEETIGSPLSNKYAEGYPKKRYYQGQEYIDQIETLAIDRVKALFKVPHANVQPYSGSPANMAVYFALLDPGDTIMGLALSHGGHLTHGHPKITFPGKYFNSVQYECDHDGYIDYEALEKLAHKHQPKIIIAGTTSYSRTIDFKKFAAISDKVGAYLLADISHIAGLVVAGVHPSPVNHAHIITTTTHKTLRGPRGAIIITTQKGINKNPELPNLIDRAVFPGLQGGPHINTIAGIAVTLKEASTKNFQQYGRQIVKNARSLAQSLIDQGLKLVTDGTDNHLIVADVRPLNLKGKEAAIILEKAGIVVNYNTIPYDPNPPFNPSGIRLGTPATTSRGMKEPQMKTIAQLIIDTLKQTRPQNDIHKNALSLCRRFPIPDGY